MAVILWKYIKTCQIAKKQHLPDNLEIIPELLESVKGLFCLFRHEITSSDYHILTVYMGNLWCTSWWFNIPCVKLESEECIMGVHFFHFFNISTSIQNNNHSSWYKHILEIWNWFCKTWMYGGLKKTLKPNPHTLNLNSVSVVASDDAVYLCNTSGNII